MSPGDQDASSASSARSNATSPIPGTTVDVGGRFQWFSEIESVPDPVRQSIRAYMYDRENRLWANAATPWGKLFSQLQLGGSDGVAAPNPGVAFTLLDMNAEIPLGFSTLKIGQFKVPVGREALTNGQDMAFNVRSIDDWGFKWGRDMGAALMGDAGGVNYAGGFFVGGGYDIPERYLGEKLGVPMLALRLGVGDNDKDPFNLSQHDFSAASNAFHVDAMYTHDTVIGHGTALSEHLGGTVPLLLDPNWNPFIAAYKAPTQPQADYWQAGADWAWRQPTDVGGLGLEAEANAAGYGLPDNALHLYGGRVQGDYIWGPFEAALRGAVLLPDAQFAATDSKGVTHNLGVSAPIYEVTPALTWRIHGDALKLTADLPILLNAPVATDSAVGSYLLTQQQGQASVAASGGSIQQATAVQARLGLECAF